MMLFGKLCLQSRNLSVRGSLRPLHNASRRGRAYSTHINKVDFGLMFDIDGVIVRGKRVLPPAVTAFQKLVDKDGRFRVPTVFVTNSGSSLRRDKAGEISEWLGVQIHEDQVVLAHSPLSLYRSFHEGRVLVSGQGPVTAIAKELGFTDVTTLEEVRAAFPMLDTVDKEKRVHQPSPLEDSFRRIEAVVLFGEPTRWETALQLLIDLLMTNGLPKESLNQVPRPHLPLLVCNMDLQWMAGAKLPRFGHGAFLVALESLYKKISNYDLTYTSIIGKPSEVTYHFSEEMVTNHAREIGLSQPIRKLYMIGDNINTDIVGANLYDQYLCRAQTLTTKQRSLSTGARSIHHVVGHESHAHLRQAERCYSILVETGVYSESREDSLLIGHMPRDFMPIDGELRRPSFTATDVLHAVNHIFQKESYTP